MRLNIFRPLKVFALLLGASAFITSYGFAQDISIEVELSSKKIVLGSTAQLTVTVNGNTDIDPIQLPDIEGFDVNYLGPSTRVSIVNGQYSSSKSFVYSLFSLKEGQFQIPAFDVIISGKAYRVNPVTIEVVGAGSQSIPGAGKQVELKDRVFLSLKVPKNEVYLNEHLPAKVLLFVSGFSASNVQYPELDNAGFSIGPYEKAKQYQQVLNGLRYGVVEFNTEIYPTRTGELHLGPARTTCNILVESSSGSERSNRRGSLFDDDFFDSFFGHREKRPLALTSESMIINVLELPQEGKPEDFSGAVGKFDFNVSVGPTEVREGDPITLKMTVLGEGNLAAIQIPSLSSKEGFKLYDPQVFEKDNIKKFDQVIIPRSEKMEEVPAISFSYFDPQLNKYQTITKGPFPIKVEKLEQGDEFKVIGLEGEMRTVEPEILGKDVVFIKAGPGRMRTIGQAIYKSALFYVTVFLAVIFWLGGFIYYKRTHRIKTDVVYARRLQAPRQAKQGLAQARKMIATRKKQEFYDAVFKTIQQYLGDKLHLSSGTITAETVQERLNTSRIEPKVIDDIKLTYEECDMIRYASADIDQETMKRSYQRLAKIIDYLERHLK